MRIDSRSLALATISATLLCGVAFAEVAPMPQSIIEAMIANENAAAARHDHYLYITYERSDRTGGHLWQERVVDTDAGRLRLERGRALFASLG